MYDFKDPAGAARWATIALYLFMATALINTGASFAEARMEGMGVVLTIPVLLALILCYIFVGRWIYRTNANAHSFGTGDMSITPGWAIGWYFIPIANLFKPYEGMKETWQVKRSRLYRGSEVRNLSASEAPPIFARMQLYIPFVMKPKWGAVKFGYGGRTVYLAQGLDEAEGRMIVERLLRGLPANAGG